MVGNTVSQQFKDTGMQIIPVLRTVPNGYIVIESDESTGTKIIAPKAKVSK